MATRKHPIASLIGIDHDAMIFSSGGSTFTVEITDIDTGAKRRETFRGAGAKDRAFAAAQAATGGDCR